MKVFNIITALALIAGGISPALAQQSAADSGSTLTYTQPLSMPAVRSVQKSLRQLGFYKGHIDGNWGSDSAAALQQFQQTHGLQVTGQLNEATAKTLNLDLVDLLNLRQSNAQNGGANSSQNASANGQANGTKGSTLSRQAIKTVQQRLRHLNFNVGAVDGVWGANTQKALKQFQKGHALQPTGQLNPATISALGLSSNQILMGQNQQ